ncbi:MAG: DUF2384 domain-containing protein [Candidatus Eremiobacteraeota bacterium]|nr:DUF2384 domain-containing protein [Candidatus Eremiobacteraeota bacterium]
MSVVIALLGQMSTIAAHSTATVALGAVLRIAEHWRLTAAETSRLLGVHQRTLRRMSGSPDREISPDVSERVANLIAIWENLAALFGRGPIADEWVRRPNRDFGDEPPLNRMTSGLMGDLIDVRRYLDLARQGW